MPLTGLDGRLKGRRGASGSEAEVPSDEGLSLAFRVLFGVVGQAAPLRYLQLPATPRAGMRRALKGNEGVKMAQKGEDIYLVRQSEC